MAMKIDRYDIRTSSRRVFRRCLRKWGFQSSMRMGLQRRGAETNINFWFGTAIHFAMEDYFGYNKFGDPRRAYQAYCNSFKPEDKPEGADEHYELGLAMLTYFLEWYPKHNADMGFQTLWFNDQDQAVPRDTVGARPAVEEEFLFDLNYRVMIIVNTGKIIKEFNAKTDVLRSDAFTVVPEESIQIGEGSESYIYQFVGADGRPNEEIVRIVPICYHGTMDRLVVDKYGRWWILDYKTAKGADTKKLETDDQISSYMWAAEQRFKHKFHGFIYLQLTKDVAKPPKRLKDGSLSVDKKQKTTHKLFRDELIDEFGSVQKAPNKYIEMLNHLAEQEEPEGDRFIRWDLVARNDAQKRATYANIMAETKLMIQPDLFLFPNPTRDCAWECPFRHICIAMDEGSQDTQYLIDQDFMVRGDTLEHNDDDWKDNIVWPTEPFTEDYVDVAPLVPSNIFNIILPDRYTQADESGEYN